jgi:hypoxanthine phosphoribosyltransferase
MAFTPDFHLPAFGCYLEVTTLEQRHVTRKNRKVRRLRELHPEIDVRIIYQRDYHQLLVKYGLAAPEQHVAAGGAGRAGRPLESAGEALGLLGAGPVEADEASSQGQTGAA